MEVKYTAKSAISQLPPADCRLRALGKYPIIPHMKISRLLAGACVTLCLTGCFTVDTATIKSTGAEHVVMNNYGWKLFDWIPLFSGNPDEDVQKGFSLGCRFFADTVTVETMQERFMKYAEGRAVECPVYDLNDTVVWTIFGIPIPYVITYKEITLSGTLK